MTATHLVLLPSWCLSCGRYHWYGACPTLTAAGQHLLNTATTKENQP